MTKIAFFGSHPLGERCLNLLYENERIEVSVVVTYPEEYDSWWDGSVLKLAEQLEYEVLPVSRERDVLDFEIDYLVSVYYPNILDADLLSHPEYAAVNLHQAELPRYRGSNVFSHSIMNARADDHWKHGTTLHIMAEQVDAGDIIDRRFVKIVEGDTARTLYEKVREASVELFEAHLDEFAEKSVTNSATPQVEFVGKRYFYNKDSLDRLKNISRTELITMDQDELYDRVRALDFPPFEPAYIELGNHRIYLTKTGYEREEISAEGSPD